MAKFRKKPVVIEAFQMTKANRADMASWPRWLVAAWNQPMGNRGTVYVDQAGNMFVFTLEGDHRVDYNDWIIQGVKGELYPCKPDIFVATYAAVAED